MGRSIETNCRVQLHYALLDADGTVLDGSRGGEPLSYIHGHGQLLPGLEQALQGRTAGERLRLQLPPELGYGPRDESRVLQLARAQLAHLPGLSVGLFCQLENARGEDCLGRIIDLDADRVWVDTNHPFAGQTLDYDIEVIDVRPASRDELAALTAAER